MTPKHERFCQEYVVDYNATQAAIRSGYSANTAGSMGHELLKKPEILARMKELQKETATRLCLSEDRVIMQLTEVYERCMQAQPVMQWNSGEKKLVETGEYQFDSKGALRALELLGKHIGMFDSKVSVSGNVGLDIASVARGTKLYKNKIEGLRGRATGLIFNLLPEHMISTEQAKSMQFQRFSAGVDTSYSQQSADAFTFSFGGITTNRKWVSLAVAEFNNADRATPLSPSDIPPMLVQWLEQQRQAWGFARDVFIDSADQATLLECQKYKRQHGAIYNFLPAWKKMKNLDRIILQQGWMARGDYLLLAGACTPYEREMNLYSWQEDKNEPEDGHDHSIQGTQYAWLPFKTQIGMLAAKE